MGQAWCKEKTTKAQDSKSPLDRVFVRCAHRIYPSLKDEGSVLGGATQRVTSSEIGYAGSPPRHVLARGRSVDSVDRPFQPSDWVDVNLEAPSTPRGSSALTNLTLDTTLYPTTPDSAHSNLKNATPIPPPRRRKQRNKDRPLPPKPDEAEDNSSPGKLKRVDTSEEPFYTSVKPPQDPRAEETTPRGKDVVDGQAGRGFNKHPDNARHEDRRTKEIYEHKVNGTGKIIPSDVVSGKKSSSRNSGVSRTSDSSRRRRRSEEVDEYERFARSRSTQDASTPNHRESKREEGVEHSKSGKVESRAKNCSSVSLPNYDQLEADGTKREENMEETSCKRLVRNSTGSLPPETFLSQASKSHFQDSVVRDEIDEDGFVKYDAKKLEDWDFSDVSNCGSNHRHRSFQSSPMSEIVGENADIDKQFRGKDSTDRNQREKKTDGGKGKSLSADDASFRGGKLQESSLLQKPEAFGKTPLPSETDANSMFSKNVDDWIAGQNSHLRYFDPPTLQETCKVSAVCEGKSSFPSGEPFFLVEQNPQASTKNSAEELSRNGGIQKPDNFAATGRLFERRLSNESEPFEDSYEEKDLPHIETTISSKLVKAISEESLPREMLEDNEEPEDFFAEKLSKDARNELTKDCRDSRIPKTPSPSPEPRIKAEILDNDHSILLKVLREETAEESNLSSMTPSLTELEVALSDMLEKDGAEEEMHSTPATETEAQKVTEKPIEPSIVPVAKALKDDVDDKNLVDERKDDPAPLPPIRKISFCAWEEIDLPPDREQETLRDGLADQRLQEDSRTRQTVAEEPPEKPSRLHAQATAESAESVPLPPRRKNRGNPSAVKDTPRTRQNGGTSPQNDRLI